MVSYPAPQRGSVLLTLSALLTLLLPHPVHGAGEVTSGSLETSGAVVWNVGPGWRADVSEPVVVSVSKVGEKRWGRHQFASISLYPGNRILLRHHDAADSVEAYGTPSPTFVSGDGGKTWEKFQPEGLPPAGMTYPLFDGQFLCMPMAKPLDARALGEPMPSPVATSFSYINWLAWRVDQCAEPVRRFMKNYEAVRWSPEAEKWQPEVVTWETSNALVWAPEKTTGPLLLSKTAFERGPIQVGRELMFADYRSNFVQEDGHVPQKWGITCMVSQDNGRSWQRRSTIALDRTGTDALTEPVLAETPKGELVCVIRRADHQQKPMAITFSRDRGQTWESLQSLENLGAFGVFPGLVTLDCGVMVMSYGRPGIWLSASPDGSGRTWSEPFCLLPGDPKSPARHTDAYTTMLPIAPDRLLLVYTDFQHRDAEGKQRKAILVRTLTFSKTGS